MKRTVILAATAAALTLTAGMATGLNTNSERAVESAASTFTVDTGHTSVLFRIKHLDVAYFYGRFNEVKGTYTLDTNNPSAGSIHIEIPTESIDSNSAGRDRHLRSPDFFDTKQFPTATFKSTSISDAGDTMSVTGDLTIKGETRSITFPLTHTGEGDRGARFGYRAGFEASLTFNRSDFGIDFMPGGLGEEVTLYIAVEGIRQ